jgi:uncharacterized protein YecT (DUF1311 family)
MAIVQRTIILSTLLSFSPRLLAAECTMSQGNQIFATCLAKEVKKAEIDMSYFYQRALEAIEANQQRSDTEQSKLRADLVGTQKAWLAYKKAQCNGLVFDQWWGGSGQPQAVLSCELEHIRMRINELENSSG